MLPSPKCGKQMNETQLHKKMQMVSHCCGHHFFAKARTSLTLHRCAHRWHEAILNGAWLATCLLLVMSSFCGKYISVAWLFQNSNYRQPMEGMWFRDCPSTVTLLGSVDSKRAATSRLPGSNPASRTAMWLWKQVDGHLAPAVKSHPCISYLHKL